MTRAGKGVSVARYRITKEQGAEIKRIEREQGHDQALRRLLIFLRRPLFGGKYPPKSSLAKSSRPDFAQNSVIPPKKYLTFL